MDSLNSKLDQYKLPIALCLVGLVLIIGGIISSGFLNKPKTIPKESLVKNDTPGLIKVDISGAVLKPAVYEISQTARIEDVIKLAGGFSQNANQEYISKSLNLSQKISDGQKIYIPINGEIAPIGQVAGASAAGKIGINSSSQADLEKLPGVGPATAAKIISSRPYNDLNELVSKKAVSKALLEKIKDMIDLN
ncbi:MAG: hypothetical protein ACD_30C00028G0005 [uncultured bacterium]|uniref:Competence protein ComEA helix-hairpin-helix repeat protein n=3 Tax=Candidatus Daviesiibacteriota TaxID=1752718 RepID=A0A0G0ESH1_9BACT|nr:MAG: hypothetical protein ACD_30C00028G0005 [uncultured bacterium]KKQ09818.1 MAG: Competence protein ComEA helix-hairpin-helix repeat protein [Candidatus Daviesbacteria bacterium GW2011_GWB1_36_5]KKQ14075.1 MAG: Competence protein ComEA helix-hairpin-helix repeat protein [Candidatus Daviesbacteria bacterium GW2011_GWA1_36_8]OGE35573.1 MAG: hypothetical protein A3E66_02355 [Candidatus Daviesbacteria bacterium RIFCSPHIGHO2_12_FULL_37_16]